MPDYTSVNRVTLDHEDLPIKLLLQHVTNDGRYDYLCLSWRTDLPTGTNRQYYNDVRHGTGLWRIPVSVALDLLNQAYDEGMLDRTHDDRQERHGRPDNEFIFSWELDLEEREGMFASIVNHNREDSVQDWGGDPVFVIIEVPDAIRSITWRKIMIIDTERTICTFRSTTTDPTYRKGIADGMIHPWLLDNSMQDASSKMMRTFRQILLDL